MKKVHIDKLAFAMMVSVSLSSFQLQASPLIGQATMQAPPQVTTQTPVFGQHQAPAQAPQAPAQAPVFGQHQAPAPVQAPQAPAQGQVFGHQAPGAARTGPDQQTIAKYVADSQKSVDAWLALIDSGKFGESWDAGSTTFKMTISRKEWIAALDALRKPLGAVKSRKIIDIGNAENPKGLPQGEYMVYFYETQFDNPSKTQELLTLSQERDGQWRVLTYQALGK